MQIILIFGCDSGSGSRTVSIAIASHIQSQYLIVQDGQRLGLDDSFMYYSIQMKLIAVSLLV
jgi:pantothenate kinase-related protein Tda10